MKENLKLQSRPSAGLTNMQYLLPTYFLNLSLRCTTNQPSISARTMLQYTSLFVFLCPSWPIAPTYLHPPIAPAVIMAIVRADARNAEVDPQQ
jgi:hypothetical protein